MNAADNYPQSMTHQKKSGNAILQFLCFFGMFFFGALSVYNGSTHVLVVTQGDIVKAILFCMPFCIIGLCVEYFIDQASRNTRWIYDIIIRLLALYGIVGFICGTAMEVYDPFPDLEIEWFAICLTSQICVEIVFIHCLYGWLRLLKKSARAIKENTNWRFLEDERFKAQELLFCTEDELDQGEAKLEILIHQDSRSNIQESQAHLLKSEYTLADELDRSQAQEDLLTYKAEQASKFQTSLSNQQN